MQLHFLKHKVVLISLTLYSKFVTIRLYLQKLKTINRKQKYMKIDRQTTISFLDLKMIKMKLSAVTELSKKKKVKNYVWTDRKKIQMKLFS